MRRISFVVLILLLSGLFGEAAAQENVLVDLRGFHKRDLQCEGFTLDSPQSVAVKVVGPGKDRPLWTQAWILNSETRALVWDVRRSASKNDDRNSTTITDKIDLPKGTYEVYYASFPYYDFNFDGFSDFMDFLGNKIFRWGDDDELTSEDTKSLSIVVTGNGTHLTRESVEKKQEEFRKNSFFSLSGLWDNQTEHQGFILDKPASLSVYAIGEIRPDGAFDYGWIKNVKTDEVVWTMTKKDLKRAGGDRKNRMIKETISFPAGTYAAFFVTDDSHSPRQWNAPPPYDPQFWGMTVRFAEGESRQNAKLYAYEDAPAKNIIVEMTRVRDKEFRSKGFTLKRDMDVRVLAIGEGSEGDMYDYGWITDAKSNEKVWEMKYSATDHAGGAQKNRIVDKIIHLPKGSYMAYFVSDGSHNYHDWNGAPPFDQEHWGLTIIGIGDSYASSDVSPYDDQSDKSILARIVRVGDSERKRKGFTLDKDTEVRIYALGEGRDGEMYDYGWIEDAKSGKTVWEMTYRMTDAAGGAQKNRKFDGTMVLKAGEYVVNYRSDDSHSFEDWNDDPPADPFNWGITVSTSAQVSEK